MSATEFAFLALGLVLGVAVGAAFVEVVRARPAPRREVRVTVAPGSVARRRSSTLASAQSPGGSTPTPGSPEDGAWDDAVPVMAKPDPGAPVGPATVRTSVPAVANPAAAVPLASPPHPSGGPAGGGPDPAPDRGSASRPVGGPGPTLGGPGRQGPGAVPLASAAATVVAERPIVPGASLEARPRSGLAVLDLGPAEPRLAVRARPPVAVAPPTLRRGAIAVPIRPDPGRAMAGPELEAPMSRPPAPHDARFVPLAQAAEPPAADPPAGDPPEGTAQAAAPEADAGPCGAERRLATEKCALAEAAREQAKAAAETLREAQRAYDALRERVDRAEALADPRELRAGKDAAHRTFRAARTAAMLPADAEAAAREWLSEINRLNTSARDAARTIESGNAELRNQLPRLERLAVDADAARIAAEGAELACREAREAVAQCEEREEARRTQAVPPPEPAPAPAPGWPTEAEAPLVAALGGQPAEQPLVLRLLRGDRPARERLVAAVAEDDDESARRWRLRIADLIDAIVARAIEDGTLELPEDDPFWGMFTHAERREIVTALSALGYRFDGLGGFQDGRVPAPRDLSLAVGYAGLDRMRIRRWPHEDELPGLYRDASVAADEWLAAQAGDLSLGRMVDALGSRAGELAEVWNAWGRIRPLLLATD